MSMSMSMFTHSFTPRRYNPCRVLADSRRRLQPSLYIALIFQFLTPNFSASLITPSIHLRFGFPTRLLPSGLSKAVCLHFLYFHFKFYIQAWWLSGRPETYSFFVVHRSIVVLRLWFNWLSVRRWKHIGMTYFRLRERSFPSSEDTRGHKALQPGWQKEFLQFLSQHYFGGGGGRSLTV
jgi:hypothetical protein